MSRALPSRPIIVGVDGSNFSRAALRWAMTEAMLRQCQVRALMVIPDPAAMATSRVTPIGSLTVLPGLPSQDEQSILDSVVRDVAGERTDNGLTAELLHGSPPEVLCWQTEGAQLLVLGSHGNGRLFDAVLGSVSEYCLRQALCPVLVIPIQLAESARHAESSHQAADRRRIAALNRPPGSR